jgi:hypothetical protein
MASFDLLTDLGQDPAYRLLSRSPVTLFHRSDGLASTSEELQKLRYQVLEFDATTWSQLAAMHDQLAAALDFPDYYGRTFDALRDCLRDVIEHDYGWDPKATGLVVVLHRYDAFAEANPESAQLLVEIMADSSRGAALLGGRLIILVQSDDREIAIAPVGATIVPWHDAEH